MFINWIRNNEPEIEYSSILPPSKQKKIYRVVLPRQINDIKFTSEIKTNTASTETLNENDYYQKYFKFNRSFQEIKAKNQFNKSVKKLNILDMNKGTYYLKLSFKNIQNLVLFYNKTFIIFMVKENLSYKIWKYFGCFRLLVISNSIKLIILFFETMI